MRQRLGIAQALVARPEVLLLDEPVSSLDPIGRREVLGLLQAIKGDATVFYSTHILDDVQRVSDHVAILDHGQLVRAQPTTELLSSFTRIGCTSCSATRRTPPRLGLAAIPGVQSVEPTERAADVRSYVLRIDPDAAAVQRGVTRLAGEADLTVIDNSLPREDLEDVFMRLVDTREHAS